MAFYCVRVELFDGDGEDYQNLHQAMKSYGFAKTIQAVGGELKDLPTGTYVGGKALGIAAVRDAICKIANPLSSKTAAVFVCEFTNWASFLYPAS